MRIIALIAFFSLICLTLFADSLWNDNSANIYTNKINFKVGESIQILVDEQSVLNYKSQSKSIKSFNINFQGGEMTTILNFIPKGNIEENKNSQDTDNLKIQTVLQGRITRIDDNFVTITGTKNLIVNNKLNSVQITGDANFSDISTKSIVSSKLIDPKISITTLFENKNVIIKDTDLQTVVLNPDVSADKQKTETRLTDAKKKELLLNYFNKILNVIF